MELNQIKKKSKRDVVINLCKEGLNHVEIMEKTGFAYSTVKESMKFYSMKNSDNKIFNVYEKDCWIFPTSKYKY